MHHAMAVRAQHRKVRPRIEIHWLIFRELGEWREMVRFDVFLTDFAVNRFKIKPAPLA